MYGYAMADLQRCDSGLIKTIVVAAVETIPHVSLWGTRIPFPVSLDGVS